jgi:RNA polymerase primary sigma factor
MATPGKQTIHAEVLVTLLEKADLQGFLTVDDVLEACEGETGLTGQTARLFSLLRHQGVEVLDEEENGSPSLDQAAALEEGAQPLEAVPVDDNIEIYLREMSRVPLLKLDEEIELAQRIERGCLAHAAQSRADPQKEPQKVRELEAAVEDGQLAREHLIKANTRLVVSIAKRYVGRGVPLLDLIQEGNLGLMKAVEKFEYRRGFRFSTYATWWIRQTITRAVADQGRTIRLPVHMSDRIRQLFKTTRELEQSLGRPPTSQSWQLGGSLE